MRKIDSRNYKFTKPCGHTDLSEQAGMVLIDALKWIRQYQIMTPMEVLWILKSRGQKSSNVRDTKSTNLDEGKQKVTYGFLKQFLVDSAKAKQSKIEQGRRVYMENRAKVDDEMQKIEKLQRQAKDFNNTKCEWCKSKLEFPTVHFMCGHTFCEQCSENKATDGRRVCERCLGRKYHPHLLVCSPPYLLFGFGAT